MHTIAITGGTGIVGRRLMEVLLERDTNLHIRASFRIEGSGSAPRLIHPRVSWLQGSVADTGFARDLCRGVDTVFHAASCRKNVDYHQRHASEVLRENVGMSRAMTEGLKEEEGLRKIVLLSTANIPSDLDVRTLTKEGAKDGYIAGKGLAEAIWMQFASERSLPLLIVRPVGIYGPYDRFEPDSTVIPSLFSQTQTGAETLRVWGDGRQERSFLFVDDLVHALLVLVSHEVTGVQYIHPPETVTIATVAELVRKIAGPKMQIAFDATKPSGQNALRTLPLHPILQNFAWTSLATGLQKTFDAWSTLRS